MISPDISQVSKNFELMVSIKIEKTEKMFNIGMMNGYFCVNARTLVEHTECDSSYTVITVPQQNFDGYKKLDANFHFIIHEQLTMVLPMQPNSAFLYSGYMLSHHL